MERLMSMKAFFRIGVLGLFWGFLLVSSSAASSDKAINVGFCSDFSGVTAQEGIQEAPVVEMVVKEINEAGGINGRPVNLHVLDHGNDSAKMMGLLKVLKDREKCVALIQGVTSSTGIAAKAWAERNRIPIINADSISDKLIHKQGKAWFFRSMGTTSARIEGNLIRLKKLGYKKIGFQGTTLAFGTDVLSFVKKTAPKYGLDLVGEVLCEPKSKDLTIQARKLKKTGAEALIVAEYPAETGVWARALKSIGWSPYLSHAGGAVISAAIGISPPELFEGWECAQPIDSDKALVKEIWDKYEKYTGKRYEDEKGPRMHDAIKLLLEAIKISGNPDDPEAIREGFYKIKDYPIALGLPETKGSYEIGRNDTITAKDITIYAIKNGKLVKAPNQ